MRIYIVEDDISVIHILEDIVESGDLGEICGDCGGEPADVHEVLRARPDVVLVDFFMPVMDGVEFVRELRSFNATIKCIMISQVSAKELISKAYTAGVDFFISKPINLIEVTSVLKNVAKQIQNERTLDNIRHMFMNEIGQKPQNSRESSSYSKKLRYILNRIGMSGEKGCSDILKICDYLHRERIPVSQMSVAQLCEAVSDSPKNMEQRVRRAIAAGMANVAHMGIEDFMNETFTAYSSTLFSFEEIRTEMDYIRGKRTDGGRVSVGFTACFRLLKKGGLQVLLFLGIAVMMCVLQNGLGAFIASAFGLDPRLGLATGSIPMVGGHGTAASFGPLLEKAGVSGASAVAIASATFGLVAGCVIGGPTAVSRIRQKNLHSFETATGSNEVVVDKNEVTGAIDSGRFLNAALCLALAIGAGTVVSAWLNKVFTFPIYIGAMLVAAFIRNTTDMAGKEIPMEEISTIGSFSLSLFLGLAMMGLKLWELADLAVPMVVMLVAQTVLMMVYAYFVVFNLLGKNYDAAVMTSGFCGFGMGATPNAMANMQAITQKYGPAPTAYFVVPLVGSLFIDFMNTIIITSFLNLL